MKSYSLFVVLFGLLFGGLGLNADPGSGFFATLEVGELDGNVDRQARLNWLGGGWQSLPRVRVHGEGQGYVAWDFHQRPMGVWDEAAEGRIAVRVPERREVQGELIVPVRGSRDDRRIAFAIPAEDLGEEADETWYRTVAMHFEPFLGRNLKGQAWLQARRDWAISRIEGGRTPVRRLRWTGGTRGDSFDLFTGIQAASENLQLDDVLRLADGEEDVAEIELDTLTGITIEALDWEALIEDPDPERDALATFVPADQFAVFFTGVAAMKRASREINRTGSRILQWAEQGEGFRTRERYEAQLGVTLKQLSGLAEAAGVKSVVMTAGDPFLMGGTDVALVFETPDPAKLAASLRAIQDEVAESAGISRRTEQIAGRWEASVARSEDRSVSSYVAELNGNAVVLSNSPVQIERAGKAAAEEVRRLADLDEYTYFRGLYRLGEPETVWLVISDDAIRKLGSPRWRIAASRRVRAHAAMQHARAVHLEEIIAGPTEPRLLEERMSLPGSGELHMTEEGLLSLEYGRPGFLTPIGELAFDKVTEAEAEAYRRWRGQYQRRWRYEFCPIALRLVLEEERLSGDITVLPLIEGSEYREWINIVGDARIEGESPVPTSALAHFAMAVDLDSPLFVEPRNMVRMTLSGVENPLGWIGSMFGVYAGESDFWKALMEAEDPAQVIEERNFAFPVALYVEVRHPLRLAGFLTGLRGLVQTTAPGLVRWENREHEGHAYVAVVSEPAARNMGLTSGIQLLYANKGGYLLATFDEETMKGFLAGDKDGDAPKQPWLGRHVNLHVRGDMLRMLEQMENLFGGRARSVGEHAWRALPVLNDLRQHFPGHDPLEVYARFQGAELREPFGGEYVWDEEAGTMTSTAAGHPGTPRTPDRVRGVFDGIDAAGFGLDFSAEHDSLRGRFEIKLLSEEGEE